jgi:hypothetical protein
MDDDCLHYLRARDARADQSALGTIVAAAERHIERAAIQAGDGREVTSIELLALPATTVAAGCWT